MNRVVSKNRGIEELKERVMRRTGRGDEIYISQ